MFISLFISLFCILLFILMFSASIMVNKAVYITAKALGTCSYKICRTLHWLLALHFAKDLSN